MGGGEPRFESTPSTLKPSPPNGELGFNGGERGIRTPVTIARKSDFESDAFDHSAISPGRAKPFFKRVLLLFTLGLNLLVRALCHIRVIQTLYPA